MRVKGFAMKVLNFVSGLLLSVTLIPFAQAEEDGSSLGFDLAAARQHQEFELIDADMTSLSFLPYWQVGDWNFSATITGYRIEGDYFVNGTQPRIVNFCNALLGLSDARINRLLERDKLKPETLTRCEDLSEAVSKLEETQSGLGDVSIGARYTIPLDEAGVWWAATSFDYKFDNGDVDKGIGSGSTDATLAFTVGSLTDTWQTQFSVGYVAVNATDTPVEIQDYAIVSANIGYAINKWFTLGTEYTFEQPYVVGGGDVKNIAGYVDVTFSEAWRLHFYMSDYLGAEEYPTSELGMSLQYSF